MRTLRRGFAFFMGCLATLPALVACSTDSVEGGGCPTFQASNDCDPFDADDAPYFVTPTTVHTGSNGRDVYQAVIEANFGRFRATSSDTRTVCVARIGCMPPGEGGIVGVLTAQAPGDATVTLESGSVTERISVRVADYTVEQYELGRARYTNPANANASDRRACNECHDGQGAAPHSPLALSRFSDVDLVTAAETSAYPGTCEDGDGGACNCTPVGDDCSACTGDCNFNEGYTLSLAGFGGGIGDHQFDFTADERVGIMAFMRAIEPDGI